MQGNLDFWGEQLNGWWWHLLKAQNQGGEAESRKPRVCVFKH